MCFCTYGFEMCLIMYDFSIFAETPMIFLWFSYVFLGFCWVSSHWFPGIPQLPSSPTWPLRGRSSVPPESGSSSSRPELGHEPMVPWFCEGFRGEKNQGKSGEGLEDIQSFWQTRNNWLVVTGTWLDSDFPFSWELHNPNWRTHIFQRGRAKNHQPDIVFSEFLVD